MTCTPLLMNIGVTGHRDIRPEEKDQIETQLRTLLESLLNRYPNLAIQVITGLAEGADQLATRLCLAMMAEGKKVTPLTVYPMPLDQYRNDFTGIALDEFELLHLQLSEGGLPIIELPAAACKVDCYTKLGDYLINKTDMLVAIWDARNLSSSGAEPKRGGTEYVASQALNSLGTFLGSDEWSKGKNMASHIHGYLHNSDTLPVYCIAAGRESTAPISSASKSGYVVKMSDSGLQIGNELQSDVARNFRDLNKLSGELNSTTARTPNYPCDSHDKYMEISTDLKRIADNFYRFDGLANSLQVKTHRLHLGIAILTLTLTFVFLFYAKLFSNPLILAGYVAIFVFGYVWYVIAKPNDTKFRYALSRTVAESLRTEFFWQAGGIVGPYGDQSLAKQIPGQGLAKSRIVSSIIKQSSYLGASRAPTFSKHDILSDWITSQKHYYNKVKQRLHKEHQQIERKVKVSIVVPIVLCVGLLLFYSTLKYSVVFPGLTLTWKDLIVFLAGLIPVFGAVVELHSNNKSVQDHYAQYDASERSLERVEELLKASNNTPLNHAILQAAGIELSREHIQWLATTERKAMVPAHGG